MTWHFSVRRVSWRLPAGRLDFSEKGLPAANARERELREYLGEKELRPATIDSYPPKIGSLSSGEASWSA